MSTRQRSSDQPFGNAEHCRPRSRPVRRALARTGDPTSQGWPKRLRRPRQRGPDSFMNVYSVFAPVVKGSAARARRRQRRARASHATQDASGPFCAACWCSLASCSPHSGDAAVLEPNAAPGGRPDSPGATLHRAPHGRCLMLDLPRDQASVWQQSKEG